MKAKNPTTGNFEEIYVKALDSLPVGTEVDFDGTSADIPIGWEQVDSVEELEIPTITQAITRNSTNSYFRKCGNIYDLSIRATINNNVNTNTEYKIMNYNFGVYGCGVIVSAGDTSQVGTLIVNGNGMYVNFSKIVSAVVVLKVSWIA